MFIVGDFNVDTNTSIINPNIAVNNFQNMSYHIVILYLLISILEKIRRQELQFC